MVCVTVVDVNRMCCMCVTLNMQHALVCVSVCGLLCESVWVIVTACVSMKNCDRDVSVCMCVNNNFVLTRDNIYILSAIIVVLIIFFVLSPFHFINDKNHPFLCLFVFFAIVINSCLILTCRWIVHLFYISLI